MTFEPGKTRSILIGLGLIVAVGIYLGFRNNGAIKTVEAVQVAPVEQLNFPSNSMPDTAMVSEKSSLIRLAFARERDPFSDPPKLKSKPKAESGKSGGTSKPAKPRPKKITFPSKRAILYDTVSPSVKLAIKGIVSEWIGLGESFEGWTIKEITPRTVTVSRDGKDVVLE